MNGLSTIERQLPQTLPELSKFVLVGREKLNAVRAEIRAIEKVGLAQEVHEQKLREAQDIADAVLDAEMQIGKLTAALPKASGGQPFHNGSTCLSGETSTKEERLADIGLTRQQANRYETLAKHPEAVEKAKAAAREEGNIVTRQDVFNEIKKPYVVNNSTDNEWYTPARYIEAAREVMGSIDLDPASNDFANETVKAARYYTEETDGLSQAWYGNIWMNPPYSTALLQKFADKLTESTFRQAVVLVNNATETAWFEKLASKADAIIFHKGRIKFVKRDGEHGTPLQGQAFLYYGANADKFMDVFGKFGWGAIL